jgi:hypothetical protein
MGVSAKMAAYLAKKVKDKPKGVSKAEQQSINDEQVMSRMSKKELQEIIDRGEKFAEEKGKTNQDKGRKGIGGYSKADSASEELKRRYFNKKNKDTGDKRQVGEYSKGGVAKKAPAKKPAPKKKK